jgi:hypothetical protein
LDVESPQAPAEQTFCVTRRDWTPVSSQVLAYPPHVDQLPYVVVPQPLPSVLREQERVSLEVESTQLPAAHALRVTRRDWTPLSSQVLA